MQEKKRQLAGKGGSWQDRASVDRIGRQLVLDKEAVGQDRAAVGQDRAAVGRITSYSSPRHWS